MMFFLVILEREFRQPERRVPQPGGVSPREGVRYRDLQLLPSARSIFLRRLFLSPRRIRPSHFDGAKAYDYAREFAAIGPRWPTGPGHVKAEDFLRAHFQRDHDQLEEDTFTADTPIGPVPMRNFIVRFPGNKPGVIVLGTHYETNYPLRNINFVGANDGASTTGLLMAIADRLRAESAQAPARSSTATRSGWSSSTAKRPSRVVALRLHLRQPPSGRQVGPRRNAQPDQGLHARRHDRRQGPRHPARIEFYRLAGCPRRAGGQKVRLPALLLPEDMAVEDDHLAFVERGVPSIDIIDLDYGPNNSYHHTAQDTMDKISAHSLTIDGDVFMESIRLIDQR